MQRSIMGIVVLSLILATQLYAGSREQANRIHQRLTGTKPTASVLNQMQALVNSGQDIQAANLAMEQFGFVNYFLPVFAAPLSNPDEDIRVIANESLTTDLHNTVVGLIRDNEPYDQILYGNVDYWKDGANVSANNNSGRQIDPYWDMREVNNLRRRQQTDVPDSNLPANAIAGIFSMRGFANFTAKAGTNRAMLRYALKNFLCRDIEAWSDPTRTSEWIRQDVSRSPGGTSHMYLGYCVKCHSGMDGLAGAFAFYNYNGVNDSTGRVEYTQGQVQPKYLQNQSIFVHGNVTQDDRWVNKWAQGPNSWAGFPEDQNNTGFGAASLGRELAHSRAFAECQVERAMKKICLRNPTNQEDKDKLQEVADIFVNSNYNMRQVFAQVAVHCKGD